MSQHTYIVAFLHTSTSSIYVAYNRDNLNLVDSKKIDFEINVEVQFNIYISQKQVHFVFNALLVRLRKMQFSLENEMQMR